MKKDEKLLKEIIASIFPYRSMEPLWQAMQTGNKRKAYTELIRHCLENSSEMKDYIRQEKIFFIMEKLANAIHVNLMYEAGKERQSIKGMIVDLDEEKCEKIIREKTKEVRSMFFTELGKFRAALKEEEIPEALSILRAQAEEIIRELEGD